MLTQENTNNMAVYPTYADVFRPAEGRKGLTYDALLVVAGSLLIALSAQLSILLPFSPVPITGQTFAILFLGALLGSRRGAAAVLAYLAEGAAGLPVFAGGASGLPYMLGPTGGYLVGFVVAAFAVGALAERGWDRGVLTTIAAMVVGNLIIYVCGVGYLSTVMGSAERAIAAGMTPFLVGDALKIALAAALLPLGWRVVGSRGA
jgi:biotin transport system substrate-specific component